MAPLGLVAGQRLLLLAEYLDEVATACRFVTVALPGGLIERREPGGELTAIPRFRRPWKSQEGPQLVRQTRGGDRRPVVLAGIAYGKCTGVRGRVGACSEERLQKGSRFSRQFLLLRSQESPAFLHSSDLRRCGLGKRPQLLTECGQRGLERRVLVAQGDDLGGRIGLRGNGGRLGRRWDGRWSRRDCSAAGIHGGAGRNRWQSALACPWQQEVDDLQEHEEDSAGAERGRPALVETEMKPRTHRHRAKER